MEILDRTVGGKLTFDRRRGRRRAISSCITKI